VQVGPRVLACDCVQPGLQPAFEARASSRARDFRPGPLAFREFDGRSHSYPQFFGLKWFGHVIIGARAESGDNVGCTIFCRQENCVNAGGGLMGAELPAYIRTAQSGHHPVENRQRGMVFSCKRIHAAWLSSTAVISNPEFSNSSRARRKSASSSAIRTLTDHPKPCSWPVPWRKAGSATRRSFQKSS
jgi:hypothetical protein